MATIANLAVSLTARVGSFEKGFRKAQKIATRFGRDLSRHVKTISRYGLAIASVAAATASYFIKQQLGAVDSVSKLSRTVGLTTEELVGYQHAIELAGGDSEGFNKSVIRMNRTIADAQAGLSTAVREIERAGLSLDEFAGMSTDQRIKLLADRYNSIGDAAGRASFLMTVFGRSGISVGNLFEQGAEGIEKAQKEAEALGLTFDAIDGAGIERANDAMNRADKVITGLARRVAIQLAPFIEVAANRLKEFWMQGNISGEVVVNALSQVAAAIGKALDILNLLKAAWNLFVGVVAESARLLVKPAELFIKAWNRALEFLGLETNKNLERFLEDLTTGFGEKAQKAAEDMEAAFTKFTEGFNSKKAESYFKGIQVEAAKAGSAVAGITPPDFGDDVADAVTKKSGEFRQVDLSRVAIGGARGGPDKAVSQRERQIKLQEEIARNTRAGQAVIT